MEFLDIPLFDDDFFKMIFRFLINIIVLTIIIRFLYYEYTKKQEYLFTYYMIGIIVFLLCFTLKKFELNLGMALGLFAIFGILRYRTSTIQIKEMTYLFIVIGVSVINSLANRKMSFAELILGNLIVIVSIVVIERIWLTRQVIMKKIVYNNLENIKPEKHNLLKAELENKTGLNIKRITINDVNFFQNTAKISVYHYKN